jgi:hypothetical protein
MLVNKEVIFANNNGKEWRFTTDDNGIAQITVPAGTYSISVPRYKSYAYKFLPEESKYGYVYTDAASFSFGNSTGIGFFFYDENNLPPLP